ncbi:midasin-like [Trifolium pratense]|nr:midasin-like [Trifolium pratense]
MDLEEVEDEERDTIITTSTCQHWSEPANSCNNLNCLFKRGINVGKKILVFGFVATSVPVVLPGFVVASAIGLAVSMPCAIFLVSHSCTQNLMSKLLPKPNPTQQGHGPLHLPLRLEDVCFKQDIDITHLSKEDEAERDIEMVDVNEENGILDNDYGQGVVNEEFELSNSSDASNVIQCNGSEKDSTDYFSQEEEEEEEEERSTDKLDDENPMSGGTVMEGFDESGEFKAPFEFGVTTVVLEECEDEVKEGDIEEEEMQKETKGLLEKIRDEGKNDMRGEYAKGISSETSENHQDIGGVVENMEVGQEDKQDSGTRGEMINQEDSRLCEETVKSTNDDNEDEDSVCNEVESCEPARGNLELEVDGLNDSQKPADETSEMLDGRGFQDEPIGDLLIETQVLNILVAEDSSDITDDKADTHENLKEELEPTILEKVESDDNISNLVNQETKLHEYNKRKDSLDADARKIADESELHLSEENRIDSDAYSYTIDLHEESSNVTIDVHTESMEVLVSSIELESRSSQCSSGKEIVCPSEEVLFNEENIWKQIHAIRKIIGYECTIQASCADELKALYIFTGVEPPTFVKENPFDPAEINEKLHFLMSIVGIKTNVP